ncbi:MAG: epoxyqueuosine reductase [Clostridia bacterium]|nr:epoxyqueuosine reductase [Clostridia bacterium]
MNDKIISILEKNGIHSYGFIPFSECFPVNKRLYDECVDCGMKSVIIFAIPYKTGKESEDGYKMSAYARVYDYHKRFAQIFGSLIEDFNNAYPEYKFVSYADNSPVNEKIASAMAGIGVIGRNTLLITEKYGSYVFLGSLVTDMEIEYSHSQVSTCINCGRCVAACPNGALTEKGFDFEKCLSYISQKNVKTETEDNLLIKHGIVWGCDICQDVCPMNNGITLTDDRYFIDSFIHRLSYDFIDSMNDTDFSEYPFSWRKKKVILHNLSIVQDNKGNDS